MAFLRSRAASLGLPIEVIEVTSGKPVVIITWSGSQPELPSLLLNSHMDVVPVFAVFTFFFSFYMIDIKNRPSVFKDSFSCSYYFLLYGLFQHTWGLFHNETTKLVNCTFHKILA